MTPPDEAPAPAAVEGPEESLDPVREQSHEEAGLQERLAEVERKAAAREKELLDRLARLQADFENHRRRARDESVQQSARGKETLLKSLLPALDSLERALLHADDEGLRLLARQLDAALASQGVSVISAEGDAFDARVHEAIASEAREGVRAGTVLQVVERGYAIEGRVVRPARVIVAA